MKLYESYVAEAKARRRRRMAVGIVGAVMLATVALAALMVFNPPTMVRSPFAAECAREASPQAAGCARPDLGLTG